MVQKVVRRVWFLETQELWGQVKLQLRMQISTAQKIPQVKLINKNLSCSQVIRTHIHWMFTVVTLLTET
ncbi:hypothetical protein BK651_09345 [Pseudomonas rhodesiae]|nr:hypothetical protein BK650_18170 [Pseudomonas rhodesiae]ROM66266.1 hypothetical protein BK651_09345 [Pseudomonas rhodesiae]